MKDDTLKRIATYENFDIDGDVKNLIDFKELIFALRTRNIVEGVLIALTNEMMDKDTFTGFWDMMIEDYQIQEIAEVLLEQLAEYVKSQKEDI